jgi:simple sugar transport system permease protein
MPWSRLEEVLIPLLALAGGLAVFSVFVWIIGQSPLEVLQVVYEGAFASAFSWRNSLLRAAPLILTGLAVALPAQAGLMTIGGEGTLALGALAAAAAAQSMQGLPPAVLMTACLLLSALAGAAWMALAGALRAYRGLNETITSLLLSYIAIALFNHLVEGPLRDPASLNKPSTYPVGEANMMGSMPGLDVHWGLLIGVLFAVLGQAFVSRTTLGFAMRIAGGNVRAARLVGLPVAGLLVAAAAIGGAAAGLAGGIEIFAVQTAANASLLAGYGYTGILVAFMARQKPLAIVPVAILMGGISAAGSLLQRRLDLPDATTMVLQGVLSVAILSAETLYGRSWSVRIPSLLPRGGTPPAGLPGAEVQP